MYDYMMFEAGKERMCGCTLYDIRSRLNPDLDPDFQEEKH